MKRIFYSIAVVLVLVWIGILSFSHSHTSAGIHILPLMSAACWMHALIVCPASSGNKRCILRDVDVEQRELTGKEQRA